MIPSRLAAQQRSRCIGRHRGEVRGAAPAELHGQIVSIHFDRPRLTLLFLLVALLGVGMWAYRGVGESLREIRATGMQALLNTQVGTLEQWISERRHEVEQLAADAELSAGIRKLAGGGGDGAVIIDSILGKAAAIGVTGARVIDPRGRILAAKDEQRIGSDVTSDFFAHLSPVLAGHSAFVRPSRGAGKGEVGRAWVATPIRAANGRIVAVLALGSPVDKRFSDLFEAARPGSTGEALAFDTEGWLLSPSRHAGGTAAARSGAASGLARY